MTTSMDQEYDEIPGYAIVLFACLLSAAIIISPFMILECLDLVLKQDIRDLGLVPVSEYRSYGCTSEYGYYTSDPHDKHDHPTIDKDMDVRDCTSTCSNLSCPPVQSDRIRGGASAEAEAEQQEADIYIHTNINAKDEEDPTTNPIESPPHPAIPTSTKSMCMCSTRTSRERQIHGACCRMTQI